MPQKIKAIIQLLTIQLLTLLLLACGGGTKEESTVVIDNDPVLSIELLDFSPKSISVTKIASLTAPADAPYDMDSIFTNTSKDCYLVFKEGTKQVFLTDFEVCKIENDLENRFEKEEMLLVQITGNSAGTGKKNKLHILMDGEAFNTGNWTASIISELFFQRVASDIALLANEKMSFEIFLSRMKNQAAELISGDVNADGDMDYQDVFYEDIKESGLINLTVVYQSEIESLFLDGKPVRAQAFNLENEKVLLDQSNLITRVEMYSLPELISDGFNPEYKLHSLIAEEEIIYVANATGQLIANGKDNIFSLDSDEIFFSLGSAKKLNILDRSLQLQSSIDFTGVLHNILYIDGLIILANDYAGLKIFDLSDVLHIELLSSLKFDNGPFTRVQDIQLVDDSGISFLVATLDQGGMVIIDISDPKNPVIKSIMKTIGAASYILNASLQQVTLLDDSSRLTKVDVVDKQAPFVVQSIALGVDVKIVQNLESGFRFLKFGVN